MYLKNKVVYREITSVFRAFRFRIYDFFQGKEEHFFQNIMQIRFFRLG